MNTNTNTTTQNTNSRRPTRPTLESIYSWDQLVDMQFRALLADDQALQGILDITLRQLVRHRAI